MAGPALDATPSIDEMLFDRVEELARELIVPRSRVFTLTVEDFIRRLEYRRLLEAIDATCDGEPSPEDQALLRGMKRLQRRALEGEW